MKSRENKNEIEKIINVFFETLTFIIILYLISCFLISFHQNILKVLFSCVNISVMEVTKLVSRNIWEVWLHIYYYLHQLF